MIPPLLSLIYDNWLPGSLSQRRLTCWVGMASVLCSYRSLQPPIVLSLHKTPNPNAFHVSGFLRSLMSGCNLPPLALRSSQPRRYSLVFISLHAASSLPPQDNQQGAHTSDSKHFMVPHTTPPPQSWPAATFGSNKRKKEQQIKKFVQAESFGRGQPEPEFSRHKNGKKQKTYLSHFNIKSNQNNDNQHYRQTILTKSTEVEKIKASNQLTETTL